MTASSYLNRVRQLVTSTGTTTMTLGAAFASNTLTLAQAGNVDGTQYSYVLSEGNDFEIGIGVSGSTGTTLTRATVRKSYIGGVVGTTKMTLAGNAVMAIDVAAEDYATFAPKDSPSFTGPVNSSGNVHLTAASPASVIVEVNGGGGAAGVYFIDSGRNNWQIGCDFTVVSTFEIYDTTAGLSRVQVDTAGTLKALYALHAVGTATFDVAPVFTDQKGSRAALGVLYHPQGRLTLQSGVPVMVTTQSAKTTVYYTPYNGNQIPIYDGTNMVPTATAEISVATTDTTKSPAAIGASKVNDWFVWNDSGTIRIGHGPDWTNDTTRSAGTALVVVNGIYLNNASITNGPAASRGTYVGTTRSNASSQIDFILAGAASGGTAGIIGIWNAHNRVTVGTQCFDSATSWTCSNTSYEPLDVAGTGAGLNNRISVVTGISEDAVVVNVAGQIQIAAGSDGYMAIGVNSTSAQSGQIGRVNGVTSSAVATYSAAAPLGYNFFQALQQRQGASTATYVGAGNQALTFTGKY